MQQLQKVNLKNPESIKKAIKAEWFLAKTTELLTNCRGGILITRPDGSFMDISLWDSRRRGQEVNGEFSGENYCKSF